MISGSGFYFLLGFLKSIIFKIDSTNNAFEKETKVATAFNFFFELEIRKGLFLRLRKDKVLIANAGSPMGVLLFHHGVSLLDGHSSISIKKLLFLSSQTKTFSPYLNAFGALSSTH